jgi:tetratricopeptide (TPR) repeat protein
MICRRALFVLTFAGALAGAAAPRARAAESPKQQAARLLDTGVTQFEEGHAVEALASFQSAYQIYPSAKILLNMGQALKALGRDAEAAQAYDRFLVETSALPEVGDRRVALARAGLVEILPRIGRLRLAVQPAEAVVSVDGNVMGPASQLRTLYLSAGDHQVSAASSGFLDRSTQVSAAAGSEQRLELVLEPVPVPPPVVTTALPAPAPPPPPARRWTWVAAGTSAALLAGGVGFGLHANALWSEFRQTRSPERYDTLQRQIEREARVTNILFITGGAAAVTAGVLYYFEGRASEVQVGLAPSPDGLCGTARWAF